MTITPELQDPDLVGGWRVFVRPRHSKIRDVSYFRGAPSLIGDFTFEDPFGPVDFSITLPQVQIYERLGQGDLAWIKPKASVDVVWSGPLPENYPLGRWVGNPPVWRPGFAWEGNMLSRSWGEEGLTVQCKGALHQLDDYEAQPEYPVQPMPYEHAIARQFHNKPHLRLGKMLVEWPSWWAKTYTPPPKGTPHYMVPGGITKNQKWTGLLTRSTGNWDPVLTSYIQTLLQSMYTRHGRWTLDLLRGRIPALIHRSMSTRPGPRTVVVDATNPGHKITKLENDFSEAIDVVYGNGTSLTGVAYSGLQVTPDGSTSYHVPMASSRQAYPTDDNDWLDLQTMPREVSIQFQQGLDEYQAQEVARAHLERFGDPGITGEMELSTDVQLADGSYLPHSLVRAGMSMQIRSLFGAPEGRVVHLTQSSHSIVEGKTRVTFDSKYRDALTVHEVRQRGRDAMNISRMLVGGQYTPPIPDQLLP